MSDIMPSTKGGLLIQQAREMRSHIEKVASLGKDEELVNQLGKIKEAVLSHRELSERLLGTASLLHQSGLLSAADLPSVKRLQGFRKIIDALQKKLSESRSKIKAGNDWGRCDNEASALNKELEAALRGVWHRFLKENTRNLDGFGAFRQISNCSATLQKLDVINRRLSEMRGELPASKADVVSVKKSSIEMDALIAEINLGDVPDAVQEFLRRASQGGVTLSELSDETLAYLRERKFADSLRVTSGAGIK